MSYYDLWAILNGWRREFSTVEFARTFPSPNPRKVLHDMVGKGLLEHSGRGTYAVRSTKEYSLMKNDVKAGYDLLLTSNLPYALTGVDGIFVWTRGGYNAGRFFGSYPIHLKVLRRDVLSWRSFFSKAGRKSFLANRGVKETLFGVYYLLYPETRLAAKVVEGLKVEPLRETLGFARKNKYTFEPAMEMLASAQKHNSARIMG